MAKFNPHNHFGFLVNRVSRLIEQKMQTSKAKKKLEFPPSCIGIMGELWQKDGISQTDLGNSLIKTKSSINKMIEALIENEMVEKKTDKNDQRINRIFLTKKGKAFKTKIQNISREAEEKYLKEYSSEEIQMAKNVLNSLYNNISDELNNS